MTIYDNDFVNTRQLHEINNWLRRHSFRQTEKNREEFKRLVAKAKVDTHTQRIKWVDLDSYFSSHKSNFNFE